MGGVMASVKGTLTGNKAFVHMKASASDDPLLVSALVSQPLFSGSSSAFNSFSAVQAPVRTVFASLLRQPRLQGSQRLT